jgi:hypothetical protein
MSSNHSYRFVVLGFLVAFVSVNLFADVQQADAEQSLVLAADMVRGHENPMGPVCALTSRYRQGEMVTWRARIIDPGTSKAVPIPVEELLVKHPSKEDLAAMTKGISVVVHLSDGLIFPMHFGPHPPKEKTDYFWSASWVIPKNFPTGSMDYWIAVDWPTEGKTGRWSPFNVGISKLTVERAWGTPTK